MEKAKVNIRRMAIVFLFNYDPSLTIIFLAVKVFLLNFLFQLISLRTSQFSITNFYTNRISKLQQNSDFGFFRIRGERRRKNGRKE